MELLSILTEHFKGKVIDEKVIKLAHRQLDLAFECIAKAAKLETSNS